MRIEILHYRDPDYECNVRLFVDGAEVTTVESVDVDPGRGHLMDEWLESKRFAMDGASDAFAEAVASAYDAGAESHYVESDPPIHPAHTECADGCGLAVTHTGACLDKPGGRVVCDHTEGG